VSQEPPETADQQATRAQKNVEDTWGEVSLEVAGNGSNTERSHGVGPRTSKGRRASASNALKHGILSESPVIQGESAKAWKRHLQGFRESCGPMTYLEECEVRRAALAEWKLERVERYERAVTQIRLESIRDSQKETAQESEEENIWLHTNPMGALKVFTELFQLSDDAHLDMGTVTAAVEAMGWVVGKANMKAWEEVRGFVIVLLDRSIGYTAGGLRHVVDALAVRTGETSHLIARKCAVVLECAAFEEYFRLEQEWVEVLRRAREAILPEEQTQKSIERYRSHHERSRDRALANLEVSQRARGGELPPPVRIQVEGT